MSAPGTSHHIAAIQNLVPGRGEHWSSLHQSRASFARLDPRRAGEGEEAPPRLFGTTRSPGFSRSDAERALVGEKRRRAAGVQEDDILVVAPAPLADQGDQAREALA
jgi:hypothetical protein